MFNFVGFILMMGTIALTNAADEVDWSVLRQHETDLKAQDEGMYSKPAPVHFPEEASDELTPLKKVLGKEISIKGFMLPMDFSSKSVSEFLLMPYLPSCIHVPPPPPNQIIHVKMGKEGETEASWYPVEVVGVLEVEENEEFATAYKMTAKEVKELK